MRQAVDDSNQRPGPPEHGQPVEAHHSAGDSRSVPAKFQGGGKKREEAEDRRPFSESQQHDQKGSRAVGDLCQPPQCAGRRLLGRLRKVSYAQS